MTTSPPSALADRALAAASDALVVDPSPALVRGIVGVVADDDRSDPDASIDVGAPSRVRLLCTVESADAAFDDFLTATAAVDARSADRLAVRTASDLGASLTVADGTVRAHVSLDGDGSTDRSSGGFATGDEEPLCTAVEDAYGARWRDADEYALDVPGRTTIIESFAERWPDAGETLVDLFDVAETLPRTGAFDPVTACTLVGARHGLLTMHIGEWAEEIGLTSRTEVARAKARLIETGLVETEREPVGVGRPRHRLVLASDEPTDLTGAELLARGRAALCE
ncbi:transcriptional regulator TbsP domain-containing protein [Halobaculum rarum]|uniref:transcriptional regulator TbsP domain-containing protein n=1 Tax=Halobaculum rarum TaxID=3075122 RepID=UPI0032AF06A3